MINYFQMKWFGTLFFTLVNIFRLIFKGLHTSDLVGLSGGTRESCVTSMSLMLVYGYADEG